jgi:hypothetical protein
MLVVLVGLVFFVVEMLQAFRFSISKLVPIYLPTSHLHSFIINERIYRTCGCLIVSLVGLSSEPRPASREMRNFGPIKQSPYIPPSSGTNSKPGICRHRREGDPGKINTEFVRLSYDVRTVYKRHRSPLTRMPHTMPISRAVGTMWKTIDVRRKVTPLWHFVSRCRDLGQTYPLCPSVYRSGEATSLTSEMEFEIEIEQVFKCTSGNVADRLLPDVCKHGIT